MDKELLKEQIDQQIAMASLLADELENITEGTLDVFGLLDNLGCLGYVLAPAPEHNISSLACLTLAGADIGALLDR